jgi:hypothetical protein
LLGGSGSSDSDWLRRTAPFMDSTLPLVSRTDREAIKF